MNQPDNIMEGALHDLHMQLAARPNASTATMTGGAQLGLSLPQSLALALGTLGGKHAPLRACFDLVSRRDAEFEALLDLTLAGGNAVPGWGSSFVKGQPDPLIEDFIVNNLTASWQADIANRTTLVQIATGKNIAPNAALATCYAALALHRDATWAEAQFVRGRMDAWIWTYEGAQ